MKRISFPIVVRVGQTKATIYKTPSHDCKSYTVAWYEGETRKRKTFADLELAKIEAQAQVSSLSRGEAEILRLSGEARLSYTRATEFVSEFGMTLDSAAAEYRDARRLLHGGSLLEAVRYYVTHRLRDLPSKTVTEVYAEMLKAKKDEGLSGRYLADLESHLGRFSRDFQKQLASVSGPEIKAWLQALTKQVEKAKAGTSAQPQPVSNRTRNNFRLAIQALFSFAKAHKYLPSDWNEMDAVPIWKVKDDAIEIFTPQELSTLLALADERLVPFLAIGAFAGLRTAEIERIQWSKVNLETGYITIDASIAKTNSRRLVPISANLAAWLKPHAKAHGPVLEVPHISNETRELVEATRPADPKNPGKLLAPAVPWRHNGLRHSFCSYRMAQVKSAAEVALEAGNSPKMIFKHYRELVTAQEAAQWFAITPESVKPLKEALAKEKAEAKAAAAQKVIKLEAIAA